MRIRDKHPLHFEAAKPITDKLARPMGSCGRRKRRIIRNLKGHIKVLNRKDRIRRRHLRLEPTILDVIEALEAGDPRAITTGMKLHFGAGRYVVRYDRQEQSHLLTIRVP